jgi:hypothetical protein
MSEQGSYPQVPPPGPTSGSMGGQVPPPPVPPGSMGQGYGEGPGQYGQYGQSNSPQPPKPKSNMKLFVILGVCAAAAFIVVVSVVALLLVVGSKDEPASPEISDTPFYSESPYSSDNSTFWEDRFDFVWDDYTIQERSEICEAFDLLGSDAAGKAVVEELKKFSSSPPSASEMGAIIGRKCAAFESSYGGSYGGSGSSGGSGWREQLDYAWEEVPVSDQISLCNSYDILGAEETGRILSGVFRETLGNSPTASELGSWLAEKC